MIIRTSLTCALNVAFIPENFSQIKFSLTIGASNDVVFNLSTNSLHEKKFALLFDYNSINSAIFSFQIAHIQLTEAKFSLTFNYQAYSITEKRFSLITTCETTLGTVVRDIHSPEMPIYGEY